MFTHLGRQRSSYDMASIIVGQDVSLGKCAQLSTSRFVRKSVKSWDVAGDGRVWSVQLNFHGGGIWISRGGHHLGL